MGTDDRDPRWDALERARPEILQRLEHHGIVGVDYVAGFPQLTGIGVWLVVQSDHERDALGSSFDHTRGREVRSDQRRLSDELTEQIADVLRAEADGLMLGEITGVVQSAETVDRDFGGSWFSAMR